MSQTVAWQALMLRQNVVDCSIDGKVRWETRKEWKKRVIPRVFLHDLESDVSEGLIGNCRWILSPSDQNRLLVHSIMHLSDELRDGMGRLLARRLRLQLVKDPRSWNISDWSGRKHRGSKLIGVIRKEIFSISWKEMLRHFRWG